MDKIVASALKGVPHLTAFIDIVENHLNTIDFSPLLMYVIDTTSSEALPYLAKQFDVLGYKGWTLAANEKEQRELLKKAIELHRYKGTPWSIKEALKSVGFGGAEISEGSEDSWAEFAIVVDLGETKGVTDDQTALAVKMVQEYKNVRSTLLGINFKMRISDSAVINDDSLIYDRNLTPDNEMISGLIRDGRGRYNGQYRHKTHTDALTLRVRNTQGNITQTYTL